MENQEVNTWLTCQHNRDINTHLIRESGDRARWRTMSTYPFQEGEAIVKNLFLFNNSKFQLSGFYRSN